MMKNSIVISVLILCFSILVAEDDIIKKGKQIYTISCAVCHGLSGKGDGIVAGNLIVKPRDFTSGKYKVRSTSSGQIPLDQDIYQTIGFGMGHDNTMPGWSHLRSDDKEALVQYIKTFSDKFSNGEEVNIVPIPPRKPSTPESVNAGRRWYNDIECWKCHGMGGHGDGPSTSTLKDDWGYKIVPPDLSKPWLFVGGSDPEDIYRTLVTGLNGSAMPAIEDMITEDDNWDLVNFLMHEFIDQGKRAPR